MADSEYTNARLLHVLKDAIRHFGIPHSEIVMLFIDGAATIGNAGIQLKT